MNTKNTIYSLLMCGALAVSSCSDFTDLQPKGKNLLETTDQLEMLLNAEYDLYPRDEKTMCGDMIYSFTPVSTTLSQPTKTRTVIMWTWDESSQDKMAELTNSDYMYEDFYGYIGKIANPVIQRVDQAEGSDSKKKQLKSEALTLRAYCHYMLVNKFAKAYNPSTAATDRGIIIMTEDKDISTPQEQSTVQECYDQILNDVNEAIELDGLPTTAVNRMRMNKACAYAVKALALRSMQQWSEAEAAAKQALAVNGTVSDYTKMVTADVTGYILGGSYKALYLPLLEVEQDYFCLPEYEYYDAILPEAQARIEKGNYILEKFGTVDMLYDYTVDATSTISGLTGAITTYDFNSYINAAGLDAAQMYLVVAEAELHNGNIDASMEAVDAIRVNRIDPDIYAPLKGNVTSTADAMLHIKQTSNGEGLYSAWNFYNRKRWNQVSGWEETYTKDLLGTTYTLTPESPLWIFPFPMSAMNNNPNLKQNYKSE